VARADRLTSPASRPPRGSGLLLCGLLSAAGHAALLLGAAPSADVRAAGHAGRVDRLPVAVELRPARAAPASFDANALAREVAAAPDPTATAPTPAPAADRAVGSDRDVAPDPDDRYLSRSALDQGPEPTATVDLPYPADAPAGRFEGVLTLFIDADGRVRRVRHDSGNLPAQLADEARQAFLAARFNPGVKDGQAVGSRLRVAVTYAVDAPRADPVASAASASPAPR
jgi:hypothetical protein